MLIAHKEAAIGVHGLDVRVLLGFQVPTYASIL
jgi:hypothetical protein